jgi:endoglucanase
MVLPRAEAAKVQSVSPLDRDVVLVHILDGEVGYQENTDHPAAFFSLIEDQQNDIVTRYGDPLDLTAAQNTARWSIRSSADPAFGNTGRQPSVVHRKTKLNGMAMGPWTGNDYAYRHTLEHWLYLRLPAPLQAGRSYTLQLDASLRADRASVTFTYDVNQHVSEAIHVNLAGYSTDSTAIKAADLYHWMGDGGARDYSAFVGNTVRLRDESTGATTSVGQVALWRNSSTNDVGGYDLIRSPVWRIDFTGNHPPGTYRLVVDGVGASQAFEIRGDAYYEPFRTSVLGFYYMRIGEERTPPGLPVTRRPLLIPGRGPSPAFRVIKTTMHPFHPSWSTLPGDPWDSPVAWQPYIQSGSPENPDAWGGHSDALDWDRHLAHVSIIYDLLLPYLLGNGTRLRDDQTGIAESGNGIPDLLDTARFEVDLWLRLRDGAGYAHGLTNPIKDRPANASEAVLYQAAATGMAAWANAANAAMLAEAFRLSGHNTLRQQYTAAAIAAYQHASSLSSSAQMLDLRQNVGEGVFRGRDFKVTAAAFLFNLTGETAYEDAILADTVFTSNTSSVSSSSTTTGFNQLYAAAAYLSSPRTIRHTTLRDRMRASIIADAKFMEANSPANRASRRSSDFNTGFFHSIQNTQRSIVAHHFSTTEADRRLFRDALELEASWGLGRNPLNQIQMTTASTPLGTKRSVTAIYTSGRRDGSPGLHPGHTPYFNLDDWGGNITGQPSWMHTKSHPVGVRDNWPRAEAYFPTRYSWAHVEFTPQQTMRGKQALYSYLYSLGSARAAPDTPAPPQDPRHPYYRVSGRHDLPTGAGPVLYYAGSSITVRFQGTSLKATFRDVGSFAESQRVGFIIDGGAQRLFDLPKETTRTFVVASGLPDTEHSLTIFKLDNPGSMSSGLQFLGLELDAGRGILPAPALPAGSLRMEFFGDSFTAGSENGLARTDNGWNSFPNVAARILGAEVHNNGIGGLAVLNDTGYYQSTTDAPLNTGLVTTYNKLNPSRWMNGGYTSWDFSRYTPDVVVFGCGINDQYGRGGFPPPRHLEGHLQKHHTHRGRHLRQIPHHAHPPSRQYLEQRLHPRARSRKRTGRGGLPSPLVSFLLRPNPSPRHRPGTDHGRRICRLCRRPRPNLRASRKPHRPHSR